MNSATKLPGKTRKLGGASVGIPPRQLNFRLPDEPPRYPVANNATATTFIAVLSGFFPPGERFFMESVRHFRDQISDPHLKAQVSGFMGQEAIHGREHERLNAMLIGQGIDADLVTTRAHADQYPVSRRAADNRRTTIRLQREGERPDLQQANGYEAATPNT